jgi:sigma-B regulation protein RsbU (phosphoserine phosphatase)
VIDTLDSRSPRIQICSSDPGRVSDINAILEVANYDTSHSPLCIERLEAEDLDSLDLVFVDGTASQHDHVVDFCQSFRNRIAERFLPLIFVTDNSDQVLRAFLSRVGTDGYLVRPVDPVVVLSQVQALLRVKFLQDRVVQQSREIAKAHRRLHIAYQQVDQELELARRIQQSMLPRTLPSAGGVQFAVKFAVSAKVSGDIYDGFMVDEHCSAFYVADAMGHGVPAGLLTIYVKKGIQPVEWVGDRAVALAPGDVLARLNRDLVVQDLSENPFVTMVYGMLDHRSLELSLARAGHPYPLRIPARGPIEELKAEGTLLGVFETEYETDRFQLQPGDRVLIYTDGIDGTVYGDHREGLESLMASIEHHRHLPIQELIDRVYGDLFPTAQHDDDLTLFGFESSLGGSRS